MPTYTLLGISGHVGSAAAEILLAEGAHLRAVLRSEEKTAAWRRRGVDAIAAELTDSRALQRAFEDVDGIFVMTPTWFEAIDMFAENEAAVKSVSQALRAVSATKVVLLSSIGAQQPHGTGAILKLHRMEGALADLPSVTSIRAGWFMENYAGIASQVRQSGVLPSMLEPLARQVPMIATADIGQAVADVLRRDWSGQHTIELEGPRRYSPDDVAHAFTHVFGREVRAQRLPHSQWAATFASWGLTPRSVQAMSDMLAGFNDASVVFERDRENTRHGTTPLEVVLAALARH